MIMDSFREYFVSLNKEEVEDIYYAIKLRKDDLERHIDNLDNFLSDLEIFIGEV